MPVVNLTSIYHIIQGAASMYGLKIHLSNVPLKYLKSGVDDTSKIWYMFKQFQVQIRQVYPVVIALKSKIDLCG